MKKRGQIAVEYLVISAVAISIAMGGWYMVQDSLDSYRDRIQLEKLDTFAQQVIASAEEVVYLGEGAKKSLVFDMPERVSSINVLKENETYYLQINMNTSAGPQSLLYEIPVQLRLGKECLEVEEE